MICPYCGGKTAVVDSRSHDDHVRRRRQCLDCRYIFKTTETIETVEIVNSNDKICILYKEKDND